MHYNDNRKSKKRKKKEAMREKMLSDTPEEAYEDAQDMGFDEVHSHRVNGETMFMPGPSHDALEERVGDEGSKMDTEACGINGECDSMMSRAGATDEMPGGVREGEAFAEMGMMGISETADDNEDGGLL
jgi:hypothetical protein